MFTPINEKEESVYHKIAKQIKNAIAQGELKPGEQLPSERDLSKMLGVSRTSLREALKLLEHSGLVSIKHGQGVFITEQDQESLMKKVLEFVFTDNKQTRELFAIRKILEVSATAWAIEKGTLKQKKRLLDIVEITTEKLGNNPRDLSLLAEQDSVFHNALAEATNNSVLVKIMHSLLDLLEDSRLQAMQVYDRPLISLNEHRKIAEAVMKGNVEMAKEKMLEHLNSVENDIDILLNKDNMPD